MGALNILLVDDDRNLATTLSHGILKAMGKIVSVDVCCSGTEALSLLGARRFDVVISDLYMPDTSGLEFLNKVKQLHRETILVLITAFGTETLEEEMHRLGIGYVAKPFEPPRLVQIIHDLLRRKVAGKDQEPTSYFPDAESNAI